MIGVWHPMGGCGAVSEGMAEAARSLGATFRMGEAVEEIEFEGSRATGVRSAAGREAVDAVVVNGDFARSTAPLTFFRPFKLFIHFQPEMKKILSMLEDRWASKEHKGETGEPISQSVVQEKRRFLDPDDIDPGEGGHRSVNSGSELDCSKFQRLSPRAFVSSTSSPCDAGVLSGLSLTSPPSTMSGEFAKISASPGDLRLVGDWLDLEDPSGMSCWRMPSFSPFADAGYLVTQRRFCT